MKCKKCGNNRFTAHQLVRMDVVVDGNNHFEKQLEIYDSETPYGPYTCTQCGEEYEELEPETEVRENTEDIFYLFTRCPSCGLLQCLFGKSEEIKQIASNGIFCECGSANAMKAEYFDALTDFNFIDGEDIPHRAKTDITNTLLLEKALASVHGIQISLNRL